MSQVSKDSYTAFIGMLDSLKGFMRAVKNDELRKISLINDALDSLESDIKDYLEATSREQALRQVKPICTKLVKTIRGIRNGVEQRLLNLSGFKREVLTVIYRGYFQELKTIASTLSPDTTQDGHTSNDRSLTADIEEEEAKAERLRMKERRSAISKYKSFQSKLPSKLNGKAFTVLQAPIVPVFLRSPMLTSPAYVRKVGIKFTELGTGHRLTRNLGGVSKQVDAEDSFLIFEDQTLLAFDINFVAAEIDKRGDVIRRKTVVDDMAAFRSKQKADREAGKAERQLPKSTLQQRKRSASDIEKIENFLIDLLARINENSSTRYTVATNHFPINASSPNIRFAWLMTERQKRVFFRNQSEVGTWNFPWNVESIL